MESMINKDDTLIMVDNRGDQRLLRVCDNKKFKWRKIVVDLNQVLKYPYGSTFEIVNGELKQTQPLEIQSQPEEQQEQEKANNMEIYTQTQAQKLEHEQIEALKKETTDAKELINKIVENNQQFEKRTQYSKEKYMKRKKAKYIFTFTVYKANIENVAEYYFLTEPKSTAYMRWDMLALILHYIGVGSKMLLVDRTKGLMVGTLILKGCQDLTVAVPENDKKHPTKTLIYQNLNIPKQLNEHVHGRTLDQICEGTDKYTNLCIVADPEPSQILDRLVDRLQCGAYVVLYSNFLEPLGRAFDHMLSLRKFINVQLMDTFTRKYQVLKNRTHPTMSMNGFGGYMLAAIKIDEAK